MPVEGLSLAPDSDDEFGGVDDEDFLQAESTATSTAVSRKRSSPFPNIDDQPTKKVKSTKEAECIALGQQVLQETWGFPSFRLKQEAVIARLISGGSAVVIFPTGGGKSLVYQIPSLAFDEHDRKCGRQPGGGVTLVVSPLIALMKDQVDALRKRGVSAAAMDSTQSREAWLETTEKLRNNTLKLLYVAPERLNNEGFVEMINHTKVRLIAIDEAHCISQWGHAFRPDYLKVARFAKEVGAERILCLTATATPQVAVDICAAFGIEEEGVFRTTSYRSNLRLLAESYSSGKDKESALQEFLRHKKGSSIVYVQTHKAITRFKQTETVCASLRKIGLNAFEYHAGMPNETRTSVQERFMKSQNIVIVATIAFGMGIDKPDIRNIIHYSIPKSLEGYSQEIGRAGRDGLESTCLIYLCAEDIGIMEQWSRADLPSFNSIQGLIGEILESNRHAQPGDVIERNSTDETMEWDIRMNALGLLNAQLELRYELIRAITPKYAQYKYTKSPRFESSTADNSKITKALKSISKSAKKWTHVDVDQAARKASVDRSEIVRKLQDWHNNGAIELQPSGVINRFRVLKKFPNDEQAKRDIIYALHTYFETSEKDSMARVHNVIDLVTARECLSRGLAKHFGDADTVPDEGCGHCSFCITGSPVAFDRAQNRSRKGRISKTKIQAILAATKVRDDPRFLARIAFGISSPRVTAEKLGRHAVFGSMDDCDFEELVEQFTQICKK